MKPIIKLYRGYSNGSELIVMGHVFRPTTRKEYDFQKKNLKNATSVIKVFLLKTQKNASVYLNFYGKKIHTKTLDDGYFKFCIPLKRELNYGWNDYQVSVFYNDEEIITTGRFVNPHKGEWGIVSDIDDTFLISHSDNIFKKLYVLLFRNVNNRKIFDDVVYHYKALSKAGRKNKEEENAFFYVSSSEWNLYRFITKFAQLHDLPKAVMLLKKIKTGLVDFLFTGRGSHGHKFEKIRHILEFYPELKFVLLGDDTQHDPYLYEDLCKIFPVTVKAVYIRQSGREKKEKTVRALANIESLGIETCYFKNSIEAIAHSKSIGITEH